MQGTVSQSGSWQKTTNVLFYPEEGESKIVSFKNLKLVT